MILKNRLIDLLGRYHGIFVNKMLLQEGGSIHFKILCTKLNNVCNDELFDDIKKTFILPLTIELQDHNSPVSPTGENINSTLEHVQHIGSLDGYHQFCKGYYQHCEGCLGY